MTAMATSNSTANGGSPIPTSNAAVTGAAAAPQTTHHPHNHHHHHHHKNANANARYSTAVINSGTAAHGQIQVNAVMHQSYANGNEGIAGDDNGGGVDHVPMYSNLSHSRDALNESGPYMGATAALAVDPQLFATEQVSQVNKQPLIKTNSDIGETEANCSLASGAASAAAASSIQDMSRIYSSREGKYSSRGQRLHRTIPRHFTTSIPSASVGGADLENVAASSSAFGGTKKNQRDQLQTLRRNKSEKALSGHNKKPVCQCPVQHVPMTYMGSTTLSSNQLLASNVSGQTKLVSNHHRKSMLNVTKLGQHQMVLEPAKGYDDELKLMTNSLRRVKTKVPDTVGGGSGKESASDLHVKIPTISKQVLNSDTEKKAPAMVQEHQIQSILKHTPVASKRTLVGTGSTEATDLINPPPFPIEMIDSLSVTQPMPQQMTACGSKATATVPAMNTISTLEQNPALPPKMYKSNRHHGTASGSIHTISKSPRMSFPSQFKGETASPRPCTSLTRTVDVFPKSEKPPQQSVVGKMSTISFPSSLNHITYSLPKANYTASTSSGANPVTKSSAGRTCALSEVLSKVPSATKTGPKEVAHPGCSKSVGESHYNHQNNYHNHHQPKNVAKPQQQRVQTGSEAVRGVEGGASGDSEKPLPVCTTSKNCSNPKEHFMPNEGSLDDDYLSECENCKSVFGSRYYLEEQVAESPQETMTLQRKPEAAECEEQAYYRTSTTLPTNTKQKNT